MIAYSILGYFMDVKEMVLAGLYIGTLSSATIVFSDYKKFSKRVYLTSIPFCFIGTYLGVYIFTSVSSQIMVTVLGGLLILLSGKTLFFDNIKIPKYLRNILLFKGGISHGLFGIGGPFFVNALKPEFNDKSELRVTIAAFFTSFNIARFFQLVNKGEIEPTFFLDIWWTMIPVFLTIYLGFKVHVKIDEKLFRKGICIMTLLSGVVFLLK